MLLHCYLISSLARLKAEKDVALVQLLWNGGYCNKQMDLFGIWFGFAQFGRTDTLNLKGLCTNRASYFPVKQKPFIIR